MWFTDSVFPLFLAVTVLGYWAAPSKWRHLWLLITSYFFYGYADPRLCFILLGVSLLNFWTAMSIENHPAQKKLYLWIAAIGSLAPLIYFKYTNFILHNLAVINSNFDFTLHVALPAGISFYVFQGLAYTADVYTGKHPAERNLITFLVFKAFFPQLVAGPIERSGNLLNQLQNSTSWSRENFWSGMDLILRGFVKKLVVADNVAVYVNMIFALNHPSTLLILVGTLGFGIQILADFSAYTDIARGCARMMGFNLLENFNNPYLALSPSDFWRRWHISLSNCIRDYIYLPLGGSQVPTSRWIANLLIVWFICGLWHGAAWNFVIWGIFWALIIITHKFAPSFPQNRGFDLIRWAITFTLIHLGWLLFRIDDLWLLGDYFSLEAFIQSFTTSSAGANSTFLSTLICAALFGIFSLPLLGMLIWQKFIASRLIPFPLEKRLVLYSLAAVTIWIFKAEQNVEFIYFQF